MVRETLQQILDLLHKHDEASLAHKLTAALSADDKGLWDFLESNTVWGGAGSIADQALSDRPKALAELECLMIRLGHEQMRLGRTNERTEMWVHAFEKWQAEGLR